MLLCTRSRAVSLHTTHEISAQVRRHVGKGLMRLAPTAL